MVTLQILVLSFLVRIQVAQLKRSRFLDRFFVLSVLWRIRCFVARVVARATVGCREVYP